MSLAISTSSVSSPSSASSTSPAPPPTPLTPPTSSVNFNISQDQFGFDLDGSLVNTLVGAQNTATAGGAVRRKPSRRANTAERRATHNAVERQRRETLNGRFLDLAALLPNLASVRRPSKSAIVNSSIALIHTQRRARSTAARELRLLKLETDQLRAEVNEWRERAGMGLGRVEEPLRSRDFEELVSGGLEESEEGLIEEERRALEIVKEGLRMDAGGLGSDALGGPFAYNMPSGMGIYGGLAEDDDEDTSSDSHSGRVRPGSQGSSVNRAVSTLPMPIPVPHNAAPATQPMIFDPNSAFLQAHPTHNTAINGFSTYDMNGLGSISPAGLNQQSQEKLAAWNAQIYGLQGQQTQYHPVMNVFNPPASAHHVNGFVGYPGDDSDNTASSLGSDIHHHAHASAAHHLHAQMAHRSRSSASVASLNKAGTPPSSAPPSAANYVDAGAANPGDAFAAAYGAYPKVGGGGNTYGAVMGLFM